MSREQFIFEPLYSKNKADYLKVVGNCSYAFARAFDEVFIDYKIDNGTAGGTVIIYDLNKKPIAAFVGEIERKKTGRIPFFLKTVTAYFGGLYISDDVWEQCDVIKSYLFLSVFPLYYRKKLKITYVTIMLPPKITIEKPEIIFKLLPFYGCETEINSLLYSPLSTDLLSHFKYNARYEIKKGLENLDQMEILRQNDNNIINYIKYLANMQAAELKIHPKPIQHFERILKSDYHQILVAVKDGQPLSAIIYTCWNGMATFNFNASTVEAKKTFVNKALLYTAMQESNGKGAKYFVLGDGREFSGNMMNVAFFKKTFATQEAINCRFMYPLTPLGHLVLGLRQFKKNRWISRALVGNSTKEKQ
jgi:hypothetical protein